MGKANFAEDFKRDAVLQVTEQGYPVANIADFMLNQVESDAHLRKAPVLVRW